MLNPKNLFEAPVGGKKKQAGHGNEFQQQRQQQQKQQKRRENDDDADDDADDADDVQQAMTEHNQDSRCYTGISLPGNFLF